MKRILFVINTLGQGGAEVAMMELMKKLQEKECTIDLYVMTCQGELVRKLPENVRLLNHSYDDHDVLSEDGKRRLGLRLIKESFRNFSVFKNLPYIFKNLIDMKRNDSIDLKKLLWKTISDSASRFDTYYDLAISFLEGASAYYVARYVNAKKKCVFIHIDYRKAGYNRLLDEDCFDHFDRIFTVSDEVKDSFDKLYPEYRFKSMVFHNIIDQDAIKEKAKKEKGFTDEFTGTRILTVARLVKQKGLDTSIEVCERLLKKDYDLKWYVLGEGDQRKYLETLIEEKDLKDRFILLGVKDNPYPYYAECDIYVHCTKYEGRSIAIQEAMTLSCPVVVSDCPGNREQVKNKENGLLVQFNPEKITSAISLLIDDKEYAKRLGKKAGEIVLANKDMPKILELL